MPRRNRPKNAPKRRDDDEALHTPDLPLPAPPGWIVRDIQPVNAVKTYRCPGCEREIMPGTHHVVAWRVGDEDARRHFHRGCWQIEIRRGPRRY